MEIFIKRSIGFLIINFLIKFLNGHTNNNNHTIYKCCPLGFELNIVTDKLEDYQYYTCNELINSTETLKFNGYKILTDDQQHIPRCAKNEINSHKFDKNNIFFTLGSCVDIVNGSYYAITCQKLSEYRPIQVLDVRKCCPLDYIYNIGERACVPNNIKINSFPLINVIGDFPMVIEIGPPKCDLNTEVLVEYKSHLHSLIFNKTSLKIIKRNSNEPPLIIKSENLCIESAIDQYNSVVSTPWIAKVCQEKTVCDDIPCVRKCCKEGQKLMRPQSGSRPTCVDFLYGINPLFYDLKYYYNTEKAPPQKDLEMFGVMESLSCPKYLLEPDRDAGDNHYLNHLDGSLHVMSFTDRIDNNNYCMEFWGQPETLRTFVCFQELSGKFQYYATGLSISCVFLLMTIIVYTCLPKLLNLHGKTLLCHVISLFCAYAALAYVQFVTGKRIIGCRQIAFFIYFSFLAAFSWLNIMCIDIWWTFGTMRARGMKKTKRFICYSIYAWSLPIILTAITFYFDEYSNIPEQYKPHIGRATCWFSQTNSPGHKIFFIGPIGIQIIINVILFIITAYHCNKVKNEIHRMQRTPSDGKEKLRKKFSSDKAQLKMNVKLFIVMGVSWFLELFATIFYRFPDLWYLSDAFNALQGVLVFLIFVFKRPVLIAVKQKLGIRKSKTASSATTRTTNSGISGNGISIDPYSMRLTSATNLTTSTPTINNNVNLNQQTEK